MAKLEDLQKEIDSGKAAILFLAHNHPGNAEEVDLTVNIFRSSTVGRYCRVLRKEGHPSPMPPYKNYDWHALFAIKDGIEATSDECVLEG